MTTQSRRNLTWRGTGRCEAMARQPRRDRGVVVGQGGRLGGGSRGSVSRHFSDFTRGI